jgi:hypothetical protein
MRIVILQLKDRIVFPFSVVSFLASISVQPFACARQVSENEKRNKSVLFKVKQKLSFQIMLDSTKGGKRHLPLSLVNN